MTVSVWGATEPCERSKSGVISLMNSVIPKWIKSSESLQHMLANNVASQPIARFQQVKITVGASKSIIEILVASKVLIAFVEVAYQSFQLKLAKPIFPVDKTTYLNIFHLKANKVVWLRIMHPL